MVGFNYHVDDRRSPLSNFQNPPVCVRSKKMPKIGVGKLKKSSRSRSWYRSIIHCGHWFTADRHHNDKQLSRADVTPPTQATTRQVCFTGGHAVNRKQWRCCSSYSWMDLFCRARQTMRWKWDDGLCTCRCASVGGRISDAPRPSVRSSVCQLGAADFLETVKP